MASLIWLPLATYAMATRFEVLLGGEKRTFLQAAGEQALEEVRRLEAMLSRFQPESEVSHLNIRAAAQPVQVSPTLMRLLQRAIELYRVTGGAFDPTIGPLMRCWGFYRRQGRVPSAESLRQVRAWVGADGLELDEQRRTVRFTRAGMELDLGAIGKGFALEEASRLLRSEGVELALLHAGTSTVYGLGVPPGEGGWKVAVHHPQEGRIATVELRQEALSVSGIYGRSVNAGDRRIGHLLDPRTGEPVEQVSLAAVVTPSPTDADALSTAVAVLGVEDSRRLIADRADLSLLMVAGPGSGDRQVYRWGRARFDLLGDASSSSGQEDKR